MNILSSTFKSAIGLNSLTNHITLFNGVKNTSKEQKIILDKVDISISSLLQSRLSNIKQYNNQVWETTMSQPVSLVDQQMQQFIELGKTMAKPSGVDIDDYKWGIMVALGMETGLSSSDEIGSMSINDICRDVYPEFYMKLPSLATGKIYVAESAETHNQIDWNIFFAGEVYYDNPNTYKYEAQLSNADTDSLLLLLDGVRLGNRDKVYMGMEKMREAGVLKEHITPGDTFDTPAVDPSKLDSYYKIGFNTAQPDGANLNFYTWGLSNELGTILGINSPDDLAELTYNDLNNYIEKYKNSDTLQISGMTNTVRDADTKLSSIAPYSLYCIVEGIKNNDGNMFNEWPIALS